MKLSECWVSPCSNATSYALLVVRFYSMQTLVFEFVLSGQGVQSGEKCVFSSIGVPAMDVFL